MLHVRCISFQHPHNVVLSLFRQLPISTINLDILLQNKRQKNAISCPSCQTDKSQNVLSLAYAIHIQMWCFWFNLPTFLDVCPLLLTQYYRGEQIFVCNAQKIKIIRIHPQTKTFELFLDSFKERLWETRTCIKYKIGTELFYLREMAWDPIFKPNKMS